MTRDGVGGVPTAHELAEERLGSVPEWTLGDKMRKSRITVGLEQDEMAARLGVSRALVSKWENDHSVPSFPALARWARETACPVVWFVTEPLTGGEGAQSASTARALLARVDLDYLLPASVPA